MTKTTWWIIGVGVVLIIIALIWRAAVQKPPQVPEIPAPPPAPTAPAPAMLMLQAKGTISQDQVASIQSALKEIPGVTNVTVDTATNMIHIEYDPTIVTDVPGFTNSCIEKLKTLNIEASVPQPPAETPPATK
ncbi:MAG: heavy-metal-associated domain-containing protein [bacterium JZ-2024 1]